MIFLILYSLWASNFANQNMYMLKAKSSKQCLVITTAAFCPNDVNPMGILQGGRFVQWMDLASAICAQNHAENICVTASIDSVSFKAPAKIGGYCNNKNKSYSRFPYFNGNTRSSMEQKS
jgi:acyl-CoA hydrolase